MTKRERMEARPLGPSGIPLGRPAYMAHGFAGWVPLETCELCWEAVAEDMLPWLHRRTKHERKWGHRAVQKAVALMPFAPKSATSKPKAAD